MTTDQRPWLAQYPKGVPANIDDTKYDSLKDFIEETCQKYSNKPAFSCMGKTISFAEVNILSNAFAGYLHYRGLRPGDKLALMMPNLLQYPIALFGALKAGLIIVNTNPLYTPREMKHQFTDSGASAILIAENFAANLEKVIGETEIKTVITTSLGEMLPFPKKQLVNFVVRRVRRLVPAFNLPGAVSFQQALKEGKGKPIVEFEGCPEDLIALQYTGGTTGVSKGAMLTNQNLVGNTMQSIAITAPFIEEASASVLCPLPLYHIFAFTVNCLAIFGRGQCNVLITNPRDLKTVVKAFKDHKIAAVIGVNTLFNALVNNPDFQQLDFSALKLTVGGGTAVQRPVAEAWEKLTGVVLSEGYGLTEASPCVTMNPLDGRNRIGSIGLPLPSTDVRIWMEEEQRPGNSGEIGELQVKGPQVMIGYYNRPEE
ncbi:MAG: AMP-binding protein, partial [Bacteroidota bacterium]